MFLLSAAPHHHAVTSSSGSLWEWFAGNGLYMNLYHCMGEDIPWIVITVVLDLAVAAGYGMIALHWWRNQKTLPPTPARRALGNMRNIFLFCGICGYVFIPVKMVWPAWRLYDIVMAALVYFTWKYAWNARDLKVVYQALGESNRLRADLQLSQEESKRKSFFLNAVSHDLRTPLNGLVLQASLAEVGAETNDSETLRGALREMKTSARAAGEMLDSFLEYARLDRADDSQKEPEIFNLAEAIGAVVAFHHASATAKSLALSARVPQRLAVRSDRAKVERIVSNLVGNAIKFTRQGSVRIELEHAQGNAEIHVIDTGAGIAPEHQEQLFEEFFQVQNHERDRGKGFGLGLSIARRLACQLGGDIGVESAVGKGSRFTLVLPGIIVGEGEQRRGTAAAAGVAVPVSG